MKTIVTKVLYDTEISTKNREIWLVLELSKLNKCKNKTLHRVHCMYRQNIIWFLLKLQKLFSQEQWVIFSLFCCLININEADSSS